MAMHQYIGARYVPRFMGNYDATQVYEALDVVDNGLGSTYIAKIPTPAGTPLTDTTHWHLYGASSGAIINLQNQIDALNDNKVSEIKNRHFLFMGDSYDTLHAGYSWIDDAASYLGLDATHYEKRSAGGRGFYPTIPTNTWLNYLIANPVADPDVITDIVICGGANDVNATLAEILAGMQSFDTYVKSEYPNLKNIYIGFIGWQQTKTNRPKMYDRAKWYKNSGTSLGWISLNGVNNIMKYAGFCDTAYTDYQHPTTAAVTALGVGIANAILTGSTESQNSQLVTYTPNATLITLNVGSSITIQETVNGEVCTAQCGNVSGQAAANMTSDMVLGTCNPNQNSMPCEQYVGVMVWDADASEYIPGYVFWNDIGELHLHLINKSIPSGHFFRINTWNTTQIMH